MAGFVAVIVAVATLGSCADEAANDLPADPEQPVEAATTELVPADDPSRVTSRPSRGCGRASAREVRKGETESAIDSAGETRTFFLRIPPAHDGRTPIPLVLDFHGYGEGALIHTTFSGMADLGMDKGFVTVTPQGSGASAFWNTFGLDRPDDVAFTSELLADLDDTLCVDLARTYATGMSNGGFMTSLLACNLSDRFAAVAPVAGVMEPPLCDPERPVPVVAFHGTEDTYVRFSGGLGDGVRTLGVDPEVSLPVLEGRSVPQVMAAWAERNGCDRSSTRTAVGSDVERSAWDGCRNGATVELYVVDGGGHTWPGSDMSAAAESLIGSTTMTVDAAEVIWDFFQAHPLA